MRILHSIDYILRKNSIRNAVHVVCRYVSCYYDRINFCMPRELTEDNDDKDCNDNVCLIIAMVFKHHDLIPVFY